MQAYLLRRFVQVVDSCRLGANLMCSSQVLSPNEAAYYGTEGVAESPK